MSNITVRVIIEKTDNGFNGNTLDWDHPAAVIHSGPKIFNRNLHPFAKGTLLYAVLEVTSSGRRMLKLVWEKKSPIEETTLLEQRLHPGASLLGWMNAEETLAFRQKAGVQMEREQVEVPADAPVVVQDAKRKPSDILRGYYLSPESRLVFNTAKKMSDARPERAVKVMMVGGSGFGKTTMPRLLAEVAGMRFLRMNCATIRDPEEWFGYREAQDGSTVFIRSQFAREIERGNLVVVLDELNRLEPWLHNTLFPLLDDDGCTVVHDEVFRIGAGVIVVATINNGYKYTGTFELDEALFNRFDLTLEVGPMPMEEEVKVLTTRTGIADLVAEDISKVCAVLRSSGFVCSTRTSLLISSLMVGGMQMREAFEFAIVRRLPEEKGTGTSIRKTAIDLINTKIGNYKPPTLADDLFADPVEPEPVVEPVDAAQYTHTITIERDTEKEFLNINAIKALRHLPTGTETTMRMAKDMAESIGFGNKIDIYLVEKPNRIMIEALQNAGITGVIKVVAK